MSGVCIHQDIIVISSSPSESNPSCICSCNTLYGTFASDPEAVEFLGEGVDVVQRLHPCNHITQN